MHIQKSFTHGKTNPHYRQVFQRSSYVFRSLAGDSQFQIHICRMDALGSDAVGVSFTTLAIIFGGLSIGIGFGLQNIASNLIYGN